MSSNTTPTAADLKLIPAGLIKNLRAVAALVSYDLLTRQNSMKQADQYRFCYNAFHGNEDRNITSQIELLLQGDRHYSLLYNIESSGQVTDIDADISQDPTRDDNGTVFVIKEHYAGSGSRFVPGKYFTKETVVAPTKARQTEKVTGCNIMELAQTVIRNVKKNCAMVEEWLDNGQLPSGKTWDDLYHHILSRSSEVSNERGPYTGWIAFELLTKFKDDGNNVISLLTADGDITEEESRSDFRKRDKQDKDIERNAAVGYKHEDFAERGLSLQNRLHIIEMAQVEDDKVNQITQLAIANSNLQLQNLLEERKQAIDLAKTVCPNYDGNNEYWESVKTLTTEIMDIKAEILQLNEERAESLKTNNQSSVLASNLLSTFSKRQKTASTPQSSSTTSCITTPNSLNKVLDVVVNLANTDEFLLV